MLPAAIRLIRPRQWIKNAFIFAPVFFAPRFMDPHSWLLTIVAALVFVCMSGAVYIGNDIHDIEEDRLHPVKKLRPLVAGQMRLPAAVAEAIALTIAACALLTLLPPACAHIAAIYVAVNILYTYWLKHVAIADIFCVAVCYVLRVLIGCAAISVTVSPWIILTTFLLALFLGFGKRYQEMSIGDYAASKRNLQHYSREFLDRLVVISGGATLMTYAIYTTEIARHIGRVEMVYTVAFVAFGLFRYLQCLYVYGQGGEPESVIIRDKLQLANIVLWLAVTMGIMF